MTEAAFRQAQAEGDIPGDVDVHDLAEITLAAFTGMQEISELVSGGLDLDERVAAYVSLLLRLLQAPDDSTVPREAGR